MATKTIDDLIAARAGLDAFGRHKAEDVAAYERAKAALNQEAKDNWHREEWHREQAQVLAERWDYGFQFDNLFPTYIETVQVGEFDVYSITERRGMQVFWTARGGYIDETQLKSETYTFTRDTVGFHVSEFADKLRANYAETLEELANLAQMRLDAEVNRRTFNLLQASIPSTSPYYVAASTLTKANVDTALREVADAIRPNNGSMPPITIAGRAASIDAMGDAITSGGSGQLYDPEAVAEIRRMGRLGSYRGANVVRLQNYTDENDASYIPENELWVFGGTVGKFVKYGSTQGKSWEENTSDYRHIRGRMDVGCAILHPEYARRIVIADI